MEILGTHLSPEVFGFVLSLVLGLLIGIERGEHEPEGVGGVRTFPLISLAGFLLILLFPGSPIPFSIGFLVLGGLLALSHWVNVKNDEPGLTTEIAVLLTLTLGAAAAAQRYWISIACGVVTVIFLQEKKRLEGLATRLPRRELRILARFLLLTGVILPIVPNQSFTQLEINPFKAWLVVVAVSGMSYASYLLRFLMGPGRGLMAAGLLGGAWSSTVTTVVLAKHSRNDPAASLSYFGAIFAATGMMYLRLWVLVLLFAPLVAHRLTGLFIVLGFFAIVFGLIILRLAQQNQSQDVAEANHSKNRNPLEITSALTFAGVFVGVMIATRLVVSRFGDTGILVLAAIMGAADVDPFILGVTQTVGTGFDVTTAALAVLIAAATNNIVKGVYAVVFGSKLTGRWSLVALSSLALASVAGYVLMW